MTKINFSILENKKINLPSSEKTSEDLDLEDKGNLVELRKKIGNRVCFLVFAWLGFVALIIVLDGYKLWGFNVDNKVLITLLTTTTANVFILLNIIIKSLYKEK
jgi:hypothetical protein